MKDETCPACGHGVYNLRAQKAEASVAELEAALREIAEFSASPVCVAKARAVLVGVPSVGAGDLTASEDKVRKVDQPRPSEARPFYLHDTDVPGPRSDCFCSWCENGRAQICVPALPASDDDQRVVDRLVAENSPPRMAPRPCPNEASTRRDAYPAVTDRLLDAVLQHNGPQAGTDLVRAMAAELKSRRLAESKQRTAKAGPDGPEPEHSTFWDEMRSAAASGSEAPPWQKAGINLSEQHYETHRSETATARPRHVHIWNEAIEQCARIADRNDKSAWGIAREIRALATTPTGGEGT